MKKEKHTLGVWENSGHQISTAGKIIAEINPDLQESEKNASLISASPDLLEALIACIQNYDNGQVLDEKGRRISLSNIYGKARAAVAKASK